MSDMCVLRLHRSSTYIDAVRPYRILANGSEIGKVVRGSTLEVSVPAGQTIVEAKIDWCSSRPLNLDARPNAAIDIDVSNPWNPVLALWAITVGRNRYLVLRLRDQ